MGANIVGRIVYAITGKGVTPGVISEQNGPRMIVIPDGGGRETWTRDRIVWIADARVPMHSREAAVGAMTSFHERVLELTEQADIASLWDLLVDDKEANSVSDLSDLLFPDAGPEQCTATAFVLARDDTYFKSLKEDLFKPYSREAVRSSMAQKRHEEQEEAILDSVVSAIETALEDVDACDRSDDELYRGTSWLRALAVDGIRDRDGRRGVDLVERLMGGDVSDCEYQAFALLNRLGVFDEDEILGMHRNRIKADFPPEVESEAARLARQPLPESELAERYVLDTPSGWCGPIALDDPWTHEVDDALMVEPQGSATRVHILIADPSAGIPFDSLVAEEGMARAATLYMPHAKVSMLPQVLSEDAFSLKAGKTRPMLDFDCVITPEGDVVDFRIAPVMAVLERRMTYEEADRLVADKVSDDPATSVLETLCDLAETLLERRVENGALVLPRNDVSVRVENGDVVVRRLPFESCSRRMVTEFMVLACTMAGGFARENSIPVVYRRQDPPDDKDAAGGLDRGSRAWTWRVIRSLHRAELTTSPDFHYGMGVVGYTQVTSPLRRFQDFAVHVQLKGFLRDGRILLGQDTLMRIFGDLETRGADVIRTEMDAERYFLLKALRKCVGMDVEGEVVTTRGTRAIVELDETGLRLPVPGGRGLNPGTRVEVKVLEVDPRRDRVSLRLS